MNYDRLQVAIDLLQNAANRMQHLIETTPPDEASNQTIYQSREILQQALAEMLAAINPPELTHIPQDLLDKANVLGIPLTDIEVMVAISTHHPSQFAGVLAEIENRAEQIRRKREYFLYRISDLPVEKLGSRLPIVSTDDFNWSEEVTPVEVREAIKAKYQIDKLIQKRSLSRLSLFEKIKEANLAWQQSQAAETFLESEED
ncbi:MAG TPA: hypothetical protein V6D31_02760 [Candidatus Sericytochromatia bacterium]